MTASEILSTGFSLVGQELDSFPNKVLALGWLNVSLAEALPCENQIRQKSGVVTLEKSPFVTDLEQVVDFDTKICGVGLPFAIAGYLYDDIENNYMSAVMRNRFVTALADAAGGLESSIVDYYAKGVDCFEK